jgi:uncharacterized protein YecE (DUF72 family)
MTEMIPAFKNFYIGTSGIVVPVAQSQYPAAYIGKSRLGFYSSLFNSLEVNSSFYKDPRQSTIEKWSREVNDDFRFTFKISKAITHAKGLQFNNDDIDRFISLIDSIGNKKGCILVQLPPSVSIISIEQLHKLLQQIRINTSGSSWKIAVEFRHSSWYQNENESENLLKEFYACMVIHDLPRLVTPVKAEGDFFYLRFHGAGGLYRGSYELTVLQQYAKTIKEWLKEGKMGYCYFNNTMGDAYENAKMLNELVNA